MLTGDPTLASLISGVYAELAPQGVTTPAVVHSLLAAPDTLTANAIIVFNRALYHIRAITRDTSDLGLEPITTRLDELIHLQRGTNAFGVILGVHREQLTKRVYVEQDITFRERGGIYRFYAQAA